MRSIRNIGALGAGLTVAAWLLAGCASVTVCRVSESDGGALARKPERIYLADFSLANARVEADREGADLMLFERSLSEHLARTLRGRLERHLRVPVERVRFPDDAPRGEAWLMAGEFVRVYQGSRALRTLLGFGAGGTKMETRVRVYDLARGKRAPALTFETTGGSNAEPGAVAGLGPGSLALNAAMFAAGGALVVYHGVTEDATRTARMIAAVLSEHFHERGWIGEEDLLEAKRGAPDPGTVDSKL